MKLYREENIKLLGAAIEGDEFDDMVQIDTKGDLDATFLEFVRSAFQGVAFDKRLEVGPGSGRLINYDLACGYYLEPSESMLYNLKIQVTNLVNKEVRCQQGVVEYIPWNQKFDLICFFNGFFQCRSDYEGLLEINRHLDIGGKWVFNLYTDDMENIVCGRVYGARNYLRVLDEFGFQPVDVRLDKGLYHMEKYREVTAASLRKLQLLQVGEGKYQALNLDPERDWSLL